MNTIVFHPGGKEIDLTKESMERKIIIAHKCSQKTEKHILCKPHDQRLAGNLAAKKAMAAELAGMGLNREAIARLLNLHRQKED